MPTQLELFPTSKEKSEYEKEYEEWLDKLHSSDDMIAIIETQLAKTESFDWQAAIDDDDVPF